MMIIFFHFIPNNSEKESDSFLIPNFSYRQGLIFFQIG